MWIDRREPVRNWSALLRRLATVRAIDLLRLRSRQRSRSFTKAGLIQVISREAEPLSKAEASELAESLRATVGQLPRRQAEVFCLEYFEQKTSEEVAERSGISLNAARMSLCRARQRLQGFFITFGAAQHDEWNELANVRFKMEARATCA